MTTLNCDFETFSEVDITKAGAHKYAMHHSTEALMLSWSIDGGPVNIWDIAAGEEMPRALYNALNDPEVQISAFNATFERLVFKYCLDLDIPASRFRCTKAWAHSLSFTGSLENIADQFGLKINKDPRGKALIRRFSMPQPANQKVRRWTQENDPLGWEEFKQYCIRDTEVERALLQKLRPYPMLDLEWERYALGEKINDKGVPVDRALVNAAIEAAKTSKKRTHVKLVEMTGLANPNSNQQFGAWLEENGLPLPNMQKETVAAALTGPLEPVIEKALRLKQSLSKTSVSKWTAYLKALGDDDLIRGMLLFLGASRTGRFAGRLVQLHNLPRGGNVTKKPETGADILLAGGHDAAELLYNDVLMLLSDLLRAAITAQTGSMFNISDLSSIESRVLGWIADCKQINEVFASGLDTYKSFATKLFHIPYEEVTKAQRNFCKPPVLGCGFGLGWQGMIGYAEGYGIEMTEEEAKTAVDTFRSEYWEVVEFWNWCKDAVFYVTRTGKEFPGPHGLRVFAHGEFLFIELPSGRRLAYHQPKILPRKAPWGDVIDAFTFMGIDKFSKKWERISASPGLITENIVQAIARDVLCTWEDRADAAGFDVRFHVHDEIVTQEKTDRIEELNELIRQPIPWAPGLLLDAEGFTAKRYRKG